MKNRRWNFKKVKLDIVILCTQMIFCLIILHIFGKNIEGPFIFGDESTYFTLIRNLVKNHNYSGHSQYNPLYPLIMTFFFKRDETTAYFLIRFANILLFSFNVIPLYFISKRIFTKKIYQMWFPCMFIFLPLKSTAYIIWAEPLYYLVFNCSILAFLVYIQNKRNKNGFCLGLTLGILFLTKQAGLVLIIATFGALLYETIFVEKKGLYSLKIHLSVLIGVALLSIPWIIRNIMTPGAGILGYNSEIKGFLKVFLKIVTMIQASMYQLSYIFISTYFLLFVLFGIVIIRINRQKKEVSSFFVLILLFIIGIVMLSALHRVTGTNIELAYGRYISISVPYVWLGSVYYISENLKYFDKDKIIFFVILLVITIISIFYSPIPSSVFSYGYLNNFDLSYLNDFVNGFGNMKYEMILNKQSLVLFIVPIVLFVIAIIFSISNYKTRILVLVVMGFFTIYAGFRSQVYYVKLSLNTKYENDIYKYLLYENIDYMSVAKDKKLISKDEIQRFWFNSELLEMNALDVADIVVIDFSTIDSLEEEGVVSLKAPWDGDSTYNPKLNSVGYGVDGIASRDARVNSIGKYDKLDDLNFGWEEDQVYIELGKGKYEIKVYGDYMPIIGTNVEVKYDIVFNKKDVIICELNADKMSFVHKIDFENTDEMITIDFIPNDGCYWAINAIEIKRISLNNADETEHIDYMISSSDLNYPILYKNKQYKLYDLRSN